MNLGNIVSAKCVVVLLLTTHLVSTVHGAKILLTVGNVNSHVLYFSRLAADLAELGHMTRLEVPSNARVPEFVREAGGSGCQGNFTYATYPVDGDEPFVNSPWMSESMVKLALSQSVWETFTLMYSFGQELMHHWEEDCIRLLDNEDEMRRIREGGFQFAVMDSIVLQCYYAIPYSMEIPYATLSVPSMSWIYRVPRLPSFSSTNLGYTDTMTFGQRLTTFVVEMLMLQTVNKSTAYVDRLAPSRPPLDMIQLLQHSSLWFFLEHIAVSFAYPQMPNTAPVGDIMAGRPAKVLPRELEEFLSSSKNGVLIASFGSFFDFVPPVILSKFCDAFQDARNPLHVVWKMKNVTVCTGNSRVKLMPWIPQNDLLADPRVHMFISHGGLNSIVESAYHAKPLIIFPISLDQPGNAEAAQDKGFAIRMNIADFSSEMLLSNMEKVLSDRSYQRHAQLASDILRDAQDTPAQRMSAMIEHVIKYGDGHLRTGATELSNLQFMMFDIFAALCVAAIFVLSFVILLSYCVCRTCCKCFCNRRKSKTD